MNLQSSPHMAFITRAPEVPGLYHSPTEPQHRTRVVAAGLERCGLQAGDLRIEDLIVRSGESVVLPGLPGVASPLQAGTAWLQTRDVDVMKHWVGLSNAVAEADPRAAWTFDTRELPEPAALEGREEYTEAECEVIERVLRAYLFGHSGPLGAYKTLLESYRAYRGRQYPGLNEGFMVGVRRAGRIVIEPGATLHLTGPLLCALIADQLDIHQGGTLNIKVACSMSIDVLRKLDSQQLGVDRD